MKTEQPKIATEEQVRKILHDSYNAWHQCALKNPENGLPKGTLCDVCREEIELRIKQLKAGFFK